MRIAGTTIGPRKLWASITALASLAGFYWLAVLRFELGLGIWLIGVGAVLILLVLGWLAQELRRQRWAVNNAVAGLAEARAEVEGVRAEQSRVSAIIERVEALAQGAAEQSLRAEYHVSGMAWEPDTFVLYRIIGNDLPPRHVQGQTLSNLTFTLENEPEFAGVEKRWVVNRIVDPEVEAEIIGLLEDHGVGYLRIPFVPDEYRRVGWRLNDFPPGFTYSIEFTELPKRERALILDHLYHGKNLYVMNNNGARNAALKEGRKRAKWILPWDGNCFITDRAWEELTHNVEASPHLKYFVVPMARVVDNDLLLDPAFAPPATEEPQLIFRRDAGETFDPDSRYGRRPKVELLYRLGVHGSWDNWYHQSWEKPRPPLSPQSHAVGEAGWVARLSSGMIDLEGNMGRRGRRRMKAIRNRIDQIDIELAGEVFDHDRLVFLDEAILDRQRSEWIEGKAPVVDALLSKAEVLMDQPVVTVVDKSTLPPSGDPHDYWHPAPYLWPNPDTRDGRPYVVRDGERVPGTILWEPGSERYDRSALQSMIDTGFALALAGRLTGDERFLARAAEWLLAWFVASESRMNPHLRFSQPWLGHNDDKGTHWGIVETKDFHYLLDAIRIVAGAGHLSDEDLAAVRSWFQEFGAWLRDSPQGRLERAERNNHGTWYDVQLGAIQAFLGDTAGLLATLRRSHDRVAQQFERNGRQPEELARTTSQHYCHYNLQGWLALGTLASKVGQDLFGYDDPRGGSLTAGFQWLLNHAQGDWRYEQIDEFDPERTRALACEAKSWIPGLDAHGLSADPASINQEFNVHYGIRPFWYLGSRSAAEVSE